MCLCVYGVRCKFDACMRTYGVCARILNGVNCVPIMRVYLSVCVCVCVCVCVFYFPACMSLCTYRVLRVCTYVCTYVFHLRAFSNNVSTNNTDSLGRSYRVIPVAVELRPRFHPDNLTLAGFLVPPSEVDPAYCVAYNNCVKCVSDMW